jgi:hypothetical protein
MHGGEALSEASFNVTQTARNIAATLQLGGFGRVV